MRGGPWWQKRSASGLTVLSELTRPEVSGTSVTVNLRIFQNAYNSFGRDDWLLSYATIDLLRSRSPDGPFIKVGPTYVQDGVYDETDYNRGLPFFYKTRLRVPTGDTYINQSGERVFTGEILILKLGSG